MKRNDGKMKTNKKDEGNEREKKINKKNKEPPKHHP
jgi:hypothetical protein